MHLRIPHEKNIPKGWEKMRDMDTAAATQVPQASQPRTEF